MLACPEKPKLPVKKKSPAEKVSKRVSIIRFITSGIVSDVSCKAKIPLLPATKPKTEGNANFISKSILGAYLSFFFLDFCFSSTEIGSSVFISSSFFSSSVEVVSVANKCVEKINKRNKIKYFFIIIPYGINFCINNSLKTLRLSFFIIIL